MGLKMSECCTRVSAILCRKKSVDVTKVFDTQLKRCLNIVDLISLGKQSWVYHT